MVHVFYIRFFEVTISGATPRLAGWEFLATLQHLADDHGEVINLLRTVPTFKDGLPEAYRTASPENCDHCHKAIKSRKETFLVRHEDGTWKQVGRNCTQDFLGGKDPHDVAAHLENLLRACAAAEESEGMGMGGGGAARVSLAALLADVAALVRVDGWTSRGKAKAMEGSIHATADDAIALHNPPSDPRAYAEWKDWSDARKPTPADIELAEKAIDYARDVLGAKEDRNDYEHNLYVATCQELITWKLVGISASLIAYYLREVERVALRAAEAKRGAASVHFGEVGKRADYYLTCTRMMTHEGYYGISYIHALVTREGNVCTWFASSNPEMELGKEYRVAATVKSHGDYKGTAQTVLTRVTVYTEEGRALAEAKEAKKAAKLAKAAAPKDAADPVDADLAAKRSAAARKAVETRRAKLAAKATAE